MTGQNKITHHFRIILGQHLADGEEIAERLGHLFVVHAHEAIVHPQVHKLFAGRALALGDFIFVMRKLQIEAAAVDVEMIAEAGGGHGRALDVPTRPAFAPWRLPEWLAGFGGFP